jgi:hypothetical protein
MPVWSIGGRVRSEHHYKEDDMAETTTADRLEIIEVPELADLEQAKSRGLLKGILIAAGVAIIAAAIATVFSRRSG